MADHSRRFTEIAPVAAIFSAVHLGDPHQIIVFFEGPGSLPIHVDFEYRPASGLEPSAALKKMAILLDRRGVADRYIRACTDLPDYQHPEASSLQYLEDRFWAWCWYTYSKLMRGELWEARDAVEFLRSRVLLNLAYTAEQLPNEGNRRLEIKFSPETLALLTRTLPAGHSTAAYHTALLALIAGYRALFERAQTVSGIRAAPLAGRDFILNAINKNNASPGTGRLAK